MAEVVDSIIAELTLRYAEYDQGIDHIIARNAELRQSIAKAGGDDTELQRASARRVQAEEQTTQGVTRTRKARTDAVKQAATAEVAAEQEAAAAKKSILEASAADEARLSAAILLDRRRARLQEIQDARQIAPPPRIAPTIYDRSQRQIRTTGTVAPVNAIGSSERLAIPAAAINGEAADASLAAETAINHALADRYDITQKLKVAEGESAVVLRSELDFLQRIDVYRRAGLTDAQAVVRADTEALAIEKLRTEQAEKQAVASRAGGRSGSNGAVRFAEGAGLGRTGGSLPAVAGIVTAGAIAGVAELAKQGLE